MNTLWISNFKMPPVQQSSRIDLTELRSRIVKTLGPDKARQYFVYLKRLLSHKLSKVEFDKLCLLTIGHENLPLHNHFIKSVLNNARTGKFPPPPLVSDVTVSIDSFGGKTSPKEDGYLKSPPQNATNSVVLSNGDILTSLHNRRSKKRDGGFIDLPSPLGPHERTETLSSHHEASKGEAVPNILENGNVKTYDFKSSIHQHQGVSAQTYHPLKKQCLENSPRDNLHESNNGLAWETVLFVPSSRRSGRPIQAPLGIPFCAASRGGGAYRSSNTRGLPEVSHMSSADIGELLDTETVRKRMEHIANAEGIDGVPVDCANLLNNALDTYLKKLIRSCLEITKARSRSEQIRHPYVNAAQGINGLWQNHLMHVHPNSSYGQVLREAKSDLSISQLDFRVAVELNPQQLGEDWPSLFEIITSRTIEWE